MTLASLLIVPVHELGHAFGLTLQGGVITAVELGPFQGAVYADTNADVLTLLMGPLAVFTMYLLLVRFTRLAYTCAIVSLAYIPHEFGIDAFLPELLAVMVLYGIGFALIAVGVIG